MVRSWSSARVSAGKPPSSSSALRRHAPTAPGDYVYLCTFPAHYQVGMHGTLTVK